MTVIYAADSESLALLPELLVAKNADESKLPSEGHYKEFTADTDAPVSTEETLTLRLNNASAKTLNMADYKGMSIRDACEKALAAEDVSISASAQPAAPKGDKPKF